MKAAEGSYFIEDDNKVFYQVLQASDGAVTVAHVEMRSYLLHGSPGVVCVPERDAFVGEPFERVVFNRGSGPYSEYIIITDARRAYLVDGCDEFDIKEDA